MYIRALPRVFLGKAVHSGEAVDGVVHAPVAQIGHIVAVGFDELATVELVRLQARTVARLILPWQAAGIVAGTLHGLRPCVGGFPHLADVAQVVTAVVMRGIAFGGGRGQISIKQRITLRVVNTDWLPRVNEFLVPALFPTGYSPCLSVCVHRQHIGSLSAARLGTVLCPAGSTGCNGQSRCRGPSRR